MVPTVDHSLILLIVDMEAAAIYYYYLTHRQNIDENEP